MHADRRGHIYCAGMPSVISIRNVPDEVRDELIDLASRPDPALLMSEVRARATTLGTSLPAKDIIALLDEARS
jgi:hypothetical protein